MLEQELNRIKSELANQRREAPLLRYRSENMQTYARSIRVRQDDLAGYQKERRKSNLLQIKKRKYLDGRIEQVSWEVERARSDFKSKYKIDPEQAQEEIKRIRNELWKKERKMERNEVRIHQIIARQKAIKSEYRDLKLKNDLRRDKALIEETLEQMTREPELIRDKQTMKEIERTLNTVAEENFLQVVANMSREEAQFLTTIREMTRERELIIAMERNRTIGRSR